jgi:hypothetical protein
MPDLTIGRLSLQLHGLSEGESRRLARLVADGLAGATSVSGDREAMRLDIQAPAVSAVQDLSDQIVAELVRQLGRSV